MAVIAVIGSGAVGLYYGALLVRAGHDVRFLLRRDFARIASAGLHVRQSATAEIAGSAVAPSFHLPPDRFRACATAEACAAGATVEWVLMALKTTALAEALPLLRPVAAPAAGLVAMCNGLGVEDRLAAWFPRHGVFGALASVCINRLDDGTVDHQAHGRVLAGHHGDDAAQAERLAGLLRAAGIDTLVPGGLLEARWRKLAWNIPFNGVSVVAGDEGSDCAAMLADPHLRRRVEMLMRETLAVANADLAAHGAGPIAVDAWVAEMFARTATMGRYLTSTLLDLRAGRAMEIDAIVGEPVRRAHRLGVPIPAMDELLARMEARDREARERKARDRSRGDRSG